LRAGPARLLMAAGASTNRKLGWCWWVSTTGKQPRFPAITASHDGQLLIKSQIPQAASRPLDPLSRALQFFAVGDRWFCRVRRNRRWRLWPSTGNQTPPAGGGRGGGSVPVKEGGAWPERGKAARLTLLRFRRNEHLLRESTGPNGRLKADQHCRCSRFETSGPEGLKPGHEATHGLQGREKNQDPATSFSKLDRIASGGRVRVALRVHQGGQHRAGGQGGWPGHRPLGGLHVQAPLPADGPPLRAIRASWHRPPTPMRPLRPPSRPGSTWCSGIKPASYPLPSCCPGQPQVRPRSPAARKSAPG